MSSIVENFSDLFDAATASPSYTNKLQNVLSPMFIDLSAKIRQDIRTELRDIKKELNEQKEETDALKTRVASLEKTCEEQSKQYNLLTEALQQQHRYLESVDFDKRKHNLIITGLPETTPLQLKDGGTASSDVDKVAEILSEMGKADVEVHSIDRLGQQSNSGQRARPIKLTLKNATDRKDILKSTKALKTAGGQMSQIYVKKDTHPGIRKELKRLHDLVKSEKEKPENLGRNVYYDWKERNVKIDDLIIDSYHPSFF